MVSQRNKPSISISLSPYLLKRAKELVDSDDFSSVSDIMSTAFDQFLTRYDIEAGNEYGIDMIRKYLQSSEGEELIRDILRRSIAPEGPQSPSPDKPTKRYYGVME